MVGDELSDVIARLNSEGVVEVGTSAKRGVASTLRKLADADYLPMPIDRRNRLRKLASDLEQLCKQWQTEYPPLVAVTGLKNAGKSSLVKSFLSDEGRIRTPTGVESEFATRRYVFWLPNSWQHSGHAEAFEKMLEEVFGNAPERLSTNPSLAYQQYREDLNGKGMRYPLVAYDAHLDRLNVGIVDCPDIQTGDGSENARLEEAKETLEIAAKLCAAFTVVGEYESIGADFFWRIMRIVQDVGGNAEKLLAVNKCNPIDVNRVREELTTLSTVNQFPLDSFDQFASYHFGRRGAERFAVSLSDGNLPEGCARGDEDFEKLSTLLPTFFSVDGNGPNPPAPLSQSRLIQSRIQSLSSEKLRSRFQYQMVVDLNSIIHEAKKEVEKTTKESHALISDGYKAIAHSLLSAMTQGGAIRPLQNKKIADRQTKLLIEEAPTTIAMSMRASDFLKWSGAELNKFVQKSLFGKIYIQFKQQTTEVSADSVANFLCQSEKFQNVIGERKNTEVTQWVKDAFRKFNDSFDQGVEDLRPFVKKYYAEMSWWEYGKAHAFAVGSLAILVTAACFATIDGGTTLFGVSALEGLIIAGGGTIAELAQSRFEMASAEKSIVEGQLSFLTAAIGAEAGLLPIRLSASNIKLEFENLTYELSSLPNSPEQKKPRIVPAEIDVGFMYLVTSKLNEILAVKEGK